MSWKVAVKEIDCYLKEEGGESWEDGKTGSTANISPLKNNCTVRIYIYNYFGSV